MNAGTALCSLWVSARRLHTPPPPFPPISISALPDSRSPRPLDGIVCVPNTCNTKHQDTFGRNKEKGNGFTLATDASDEPVAKSAKKEIETQMRWDRIVQNDLENLPLGFVVAWVRAAAEGNPAKPTVPGLGSRGWGGSAWRVCRGLCFQSRSH